MKQFLKGFFVGIGFLLFFIFGLFITKAFDIFVIKNTIDITRDVEVSKSIRYDEFVSYPRFSASSFLSTKTQLFDEDKAKISSSFESVLEEVKKFEMCSGGSYTLEPNYSYKDGVTNLSGYRFNASFECKFKLDKGAEYKDMLGKINEILKENEYIVLNTPSIRPVISDATLQNIQNELYDSLLDKANAISSDYSNKLQKECFVKFINYDANNYYYKAASMDTSYNTPIVNEKDQKLKASVGYKCQ